MRESLQNRCEAQIRNEAALRKGHMLEFESIMKLGAMMYASAGREVDADRIKECKRLLKERTGIFSNFRGTLEYIVQIKMALSDNPAAYIDGVLKVYEQLKSGRVLPGELVAMAATTICDNCPPEARNKVAEQTREAFDKVNRQHRFLTDEADMAIIALMVMAGKNPDRVSAQAEELFTELKDSFRIGSDAAQTAAMVLALSDKPTAQKVSDFVALYETCKAEKHATSKDKEMAVYAAYADVKGDRTAIVSEIGEVDDWLKDQKGYGMLGIGSSMRRLFAATIVLEDHQKSAPAMTIGTTSAVVQTIVEELVLILVTIIVTSVVISSSSHTSNH